MSLLLSSSALDARRAAVAGPLRPLAQSLAAELEPLIQRPLYFPAEKALLSREGGRCALDGTLLAFDPFAPHEHRCPRCGTTYRGDVHDRFWIYWYQLWLAERAVHAAALAALGVDDRYAKLADVILAGYAERYSAYPNVDNVLGPTRLFFSTYLESIWLLQICIATDLMRPIAPALVGDVLDRIVDPSRAIIAEYNEGGSNRQVWNAVAVLAAARLLGDSTAAEDAVNGPGGIIAHLAGGILSDGTWYEGENYHLFAHRGLWYGVTLAEQAGMHIPPPLLDRFHKGFLTPFLSALPDLTLPSRRDSQYAISLRQWRIAEHCELGFTRTGDSMLGGALARLYDDSVPRGDTGRRISSADVERNGPPSSLTRADLGWRALLCARESLPVLEPIVPRSSLLEGQGLAVFRRSEGHAYVALDYGHSGGGHGHPDRLNVLVANGPTRWLDDYGTGSYVDPSLHWYRSTLAHNAPLVNGKSQLPVNGRLVAFDERGAAGWIRAAADGVAPTPVTMTRTLVAMPDYLIDELRWDANGNRDTTVDLPLHVDVEFDSGVDAPGESVFAGGQGTEDGFRFVRDTSCQRAAPSAVVHGVATQATDRMEIWTQSDHAVEWWRAVAPGPPGAGDRAFRVARCHSAAGCQRAVLSWAGAVTEVQFDEGVRVALADGSTHEHSQTSGGWHIDLFAESARSSIDLGGFVAPSADAAASPLAVIERDAITLPKNGARVTFALTEAHYRRSEENWTAAGAPTASVSLAWDTGRLRVEVDVAASELTFAAADAGNRYDNEHPDINGDSVQLYLVSDSGRSGWMLVPELDSSGVRVRPLEGWSDAPSATIEASWDRIGRGYRIVSEIGGVIPRALDVIVNEMPRGRQRRRGQLVLSGGRGEFVYLRGDRHDVVHLVPLRLPDV